MASGKIKDPKCSIIHHIVWDNFEFTKQRIAPFLGCFLAMIKSRMIRKHLNYCIIIMERGWQSKSLMIKWGRHLSTYFSEKR